MSIDIEPMGAVRTTRAMAGRTDAGQRYATYKERIGWAVRQHMDSPLSNAVGVSMEFRMPIPKSLAGKVEPGQLHTKKPDIDNLIKGLFDAANGIAWVDDNRVAHIESAKKIYGYNPGITLIIDEIGGLAHGQEKQPKQTDKAKQKATRAEASRARRDIRRRV